MLIYRVISQVMATFHGKCPSLSHDMPVLKLIFSDIGIEIVDLLELFAVYMFFYLFTFPLFMFLNPGCVSYVQSIPMLYILIL
jgi:hypothetical protein